MTDSVKSAAEAAAREAAERFDTGTRERPLPVNAARQSAFVSGAEWQREQDESEAMRVAAQRAVRISELEAEVAELTEALTATHRNGERDLQKMEIAWGELAALKAKLAKVRELHFRFSCFELEDSCPDTSDEHREAHHHESSDDAGEFYCDQLFIRAHCGYCRDDDGERIDWPCETVAILDGEADDH